VHLFLIAQLLQFTQLFAPNFQRACVTIQKLSTILNSCARLPRKPVAFEITSGMISTVTCKTLRHDLVLIWDPGLSTAHGLVASASVFVWRATASLTSSAAARPASSAHIRATRVIAAVESSQIVLLLVLLHESGVDTFLHDRVNPSRLQHGLKLKLSLSLSLSLARSLSFEQELS
jgi:hypothetical protein